MLISVLQSSNGAQFLNTACVAALIGCFLWALPPAAVTIVLVTVIFPVTKIYVSE